MTERTNFRTDGGATWLNLLATRGQSFGARPVERLPNVAAVGAWLDLMGMPCADEIREDGRVSLIELRESLRELAMAAVEGRQAHPAARDHIAQVAATPLGALSNGDGEMALAVAQAAIAASALVTLRGPDRHLLKECDEADCRWVFLDPSGRRRWCPAPACASRGRVRAHRAAQAAN